MNNISPISAETVALRIHVIRGEKVILDSDLAAIYGVTTSNFNKAVRRNVDRFPEDFMFQLTKEEYESLRFQIGISKTGRGGRRHMPYAFTEHGALMAANILNSETAVRASIQVIRAFVKMRYMLESNKELARKIDALERKYDSQFKVVFEAIRKLMVPPDKPKGEIGFATRKKKS